MTIVEYTRLTNEALRRRRVRLAIGRIRQSYLHAYLLWYVLRWRKLRAIWEYENAWLARSVICTDTAEIHSEILSVRDTTEIRLC